MATCECSDERNKTYRQQDYWEAMLKKQEERNDHLSQRRCEMTHLMTYFDDKNVCPQQKAIDLECSANLQKLCDRQTCLVRELSALQEKESQYKQSLCGAGIVVGEKDQLSRKCQCETDELKRETDELKKYNMELMEANRKIGDDVEDLQLEYAQYKENVAGPLTRQLERERTRARKLEALIAERAKNRAGEDSKQLDELYALKAKLNVLVQNVNTASEYKTKLLEEREELINSYDHMQEELVKLKLNEAKVISDLANALKGLKEQEDPCKCASKVKNDDDKAGPCRPKTCPNATTTEDPDGQACFGDDDKKKPVEKVVSPATGTEMVYEPDGEVAHAEE